jgi:hypothetical protein
LQDFVNAHARAYQEKIDYSCRSFCSATINFSDGEVVARSRHLRFAQEGKAFLGSRTYLNTKIFIGVLYERILAAIFLVWQDIYEQRGSKRGLGVLQEGF